MVESKKVFNENVITNIITNVLLTNTQDAIKTTASEYFAFKTQETKKTYKAFTELRQQVKLMDKRLQSVVPIELYFEAYELILDIRKFFLGDKGEISYTLLFSTKQRNGNAIINQVEISHELFRNLLMNENKQLIGLINMKENLRFNHVLINNLKAILRQLNAQGIDFSLSQNASSFKITNDIIGKSSEFKSLNLFKSAIENAKYRDGERYLFSIDVKRTINKEERAIFSFFIKQVLGNPVSSSIFSAIGKYAADEILAKETVVEKSYGDLINAPNPNTGNLSEIYQLAKLRLNNKKNKFQKRKAVPGKDLYAIFAEVLRNTDPFYMGGDILSTQIKSFLGSCPSLTSFSTIRTTINKFNKVLQQDDLNELKQSLENLLIKKENIISKEEQKLAQELTQTLKEFIFEKE